jgi:hypothetical protein
MGRLALLGVGYVLGARAGRGRYEQIATVASRVATRLDEYSRERPSVGAAVRDATRTRPEG